MRKENKPTFVTITLNSGIVVTGELTENKDTSIAAISVIQNVPLVRKKYLNSNHTVDKDGRITYEDHRYEYVEVRSKTVATVFNSTIKEIVYF
jgi:hypothetical protein